MLKDKIKNIFKLSNWKRWTILIFSFIIVGLFIGLSSGLKIKESSYSNDYKNGVSLVVSPKVNGNDLDETDSKKYLNEFELMLKNDYPDSYVSSSYENDNVWEIKATNLDQSSLREAIVKQPITLLPINADITTSLYQDTYNNNDLFNYVNLQGNSINLYANSSNLNDFWKWAINNDKNHDPKKVIIWKNFEILKKKIQQEVELEPNHYSGTIYEYLWVNGWTPEKEESKGENDTTTPPLLKDQIEIDGKIYKPSDFLVSKNDISVFSSPSPSNLAKSITVDRSCLTNIDSSNNDDLFYNLSFWINPYSLDNSIIAPMYANNGTHAYTFLIIALVSFFSIISIYIVINYGYLGILAIVLLAIFIFLSLLMISVFFGDYDSVNISALVFSVIIVLDFIFLFLDNIKKNVLKGNNLDKAVKNTSKKFMRVSFFRSFILILFVGLFYVSLSTIFGNFSLIVLITTFAIPIILIPLLFSLSRLIVGMNRMENKTQLIGLWTKKHASFIDNSTTSILDQEKNDETFEIDPSKRFDDINKLLSESNDMKFKLKKQRNHYIYNNVFKKWFKWIIIGLFSFIIVFGFLTYLISFFNHGHSMFIDGLKISDYDNNNYFMRIAKYNNFVFSDSEINNIKTILSKYSNVLDVKSIDNYMIQIVLKSDFDSSNINMIVKQIMQSNNSNSDLIIIPSKLIETSSFEIVSKLSLAAFLGLIVSTLFIFLWTNWTFALSFLITFISSSLLFIFMLGFNWIEINSNLSIVLMASLIILILNSTSLISNVYYQMKTKRIEVITKDEIENVVIKQSFKSLNSSLRTSSVALLAFVLFSIMYGSLPIEMTLFMIFSIIINVILSTLLLPKLIFSFETVRSRIKRKVILINYWDTEKIREQTFKGINNLK